MCDAFHCRLINERIYLERAMRIVKRNGMACQTIFFRSDFPFQLHEYLFIAHRGLGAVIASGTVTLLARYAFLNAERRGNSFHGGAVCRCMTLQTHRVVRGIGAMILRRIRRSGAIG